MQHLDTERIAAFDHEPPTTEELAHLSACVVCRSERDAFDALARLAAHDGFRTLAIEAPRLTDWEQLSVALRVEGMLTSASDHRVPETPLVVRALDGTGERIAREPHAVPTVARRSHASTPARGVPRWLRAAAAAVLVVASVVGGRISAGASLLPLERSAESTASRAADGFDATIRPASLGGEDTFASVSQATAVLNNAQAEYERASLWLAANDTTVRSSDVYRARLAALDQMMAASRAALREAPQDPVLNHYYLAASTAREVTLQQLSGALPVDKTIEGY